MSGTGGGAGWIAVMAAAFGVACGRHALPVPSPPRNDDLFARASAARPGTYPRWASRRQTYWTVVGVDGDDAEALVNADGMVEVVVGAYSLEPFVELDGTFVTWVDVTMTHELVDGALPIPTVEWRHAAFTLRVTAFASGAPGASTLYARYRLTPADARRRMRLWIAVRPLQVLPPWQDLNVRGGVGHLPAVTPRHDGLRLGERTLVTAPRPAYRASLPFEVPSLGSPALRFDPTDATGEVAVDLAIQLHDGQAIPSLPAPAAAAHAMIDRAFGETVLSWQARLERPRIALPPAAGDLALVAPSTLAYVLVHRDGAALKPGSRTYERSWIRDGALTASTLLSFGHAEPVREFLDWYAAFQFADGKVPCCVDARGADPTPEHDSDGEFIYAVAEYWRFTHDRETLARLWPHVVRAAAHIEALRATRLGPAFTGSAVYGLLPESISHEGYHERPVHSYWDDFFALRGLRDTAALARVMHDAPEQRRYERASREFAQALAASLARVIREHDLPYVPGSVELADFDPTSTAIAVTVADAARVPPRDALVRTFERYHDEILRWGAGHPEREGYTPYEARNAEALVRLGRREAAYDVLRFVLAGRRPPAWQAWGEVVWQDAAVPRFIGDMPHTWAAQAVVRTLRTMLVYEREADQALVVAAGIPRAWLDEPAAVVVDGLPTYHGPLGYRLERSGAHIVRLAVEGGLVVPPGGLVLAPPVRASAWVRVDGHLVPSRGDGSVLVRRVPVVVTWEERS